MSISHHPAVVFSDVSFAWPDGTPVFGHLHTAFGEGRTGLIGANGTGKTTLLRLVAGQLAPTGGSITTSHQVGYLPQQLTLHTEATVADLLGIRGRLDALRAIEAGDADPRHFDALADDWNVEARARATLDSLGLATVGLDRAVGTLAGGETVLTALAGLRLRGDEVVLLDEPTNNLDRDARHRLYDTISAWRGALIVVSHDVTLLNLMDETAELRAGALEVYGGNYDAYRDHLAREQAAAEQSLRTAQQKLRAEQRQQIEAQTKLARRQRYARTDFENKRKPKIVMRQRATEAQVSAGKLRGQLEAKVDAARDLVDQQAERVRADDRIRIHLPNPGVGSGRRLVEFRNPDGRGFMVQGPERVALTGPNGVGKTRLLESLIRRDRPVGTGHVEAILHAERTGYLPQRLDHLQETHSLMEAVRAVAPKVPPGDVRANLARFLFRAETIHRPVGDLSGGERFRVALARLLLADPPNQLLVLDEPTNNLDLVSIDELVDALEAYQGGIIVVSHDEAFLGRLGIHTWLGLDADGLLRHISPSPAGSAPHAT